MSAGPEITDYDLLSADDAKQLAGISLLPHDLRFEALTKILAGRDQAALIELLSQVLGLANSVVANNREMIELYLITEEGYSDRLAGKINLPTVFGALRGVELAKGIEPAKVCHGCAFRRGTMANQSPVTTDDAGYCVDDAQIFNCHEVLDDNGEPVSACAGYALAVVARKRVAG